MLSGAAWNAGQDAAHDALNALLDARLAEHYVAPPQPVSVDLRVSDCAGENRRFVLGPRIQSLPLDENEATGAAARITLSHAFLRAMLDDPTSFDPRSAAAMSLGGVRIDGSARLAAYWLQLLKRPTAAARAALERAAQRAPAKLQRVPICSADASGSDALREVIADTLEASIPLVVRDLIAWPETKWTLGEWRRRERTTVLRAHPLTGEPQTVADFIDAFGSHGSHATNATNATNATEAGAASYTEGCLLPSAWDARFALPKLPASLFGAAQLWFGHASPSALVTRLHCDLASSFLAQIHGRKRVRLYAPSQEQAVYALDSYNMYRPCRVDVAAPDLERFPRFAQARGVDVVLEPGELLVIPTGWFHCVWALDPVLSISRFADDTAATSILHSRSTSLHSSAT